ncbi:hypothetical protein ABIC78_004088 [Novosphingobium sp. 1529]|uniref:hypothetical protein n=1 Tax=Novosphingobium sp. 1529 TaxID=3156424 RepID=UPI003395E784
MLKDCYQFWHRNAVAQHAKWVFTAFSALLASCSAVHASTYVEEKVKCPVGGEKFKYMGLASISTWGAFPDGMPLGSGQFPTLPPQCPSNGLVMYRDFTPQEVSKLAVFVASPEFKALRSSGETPYYLAYKTAVFLGDAKPYWLLLSASWEAKNLDPLGSLARRYNEEFVTAAKAVQIDATEFESIAIRFRAANALRELGHFDDAEAIRSAIVISPNAGGADDRAATNRTGWSKMIADLAAPIARKDSSRSPIDMLGEREVIFRCLSKEAAEKFKQPLPQPLSTFEQAYCARPEFVDHLKEQRAWLTAQDQ